MEHKFYFYIFDDKTGPIPTNEMLYVGSSIIDTNDDDYYTQTTDEYNNKLRDFLISQGILQFIPLKNPSINTEKDCVTICYYHNKKAYDYIYSFYPQYIMYPLAHHELDKLYWAHGLEGWYDKRSNILSENETDED